MATSLAWGTDTASWAEAALAIVSEADSAISWADEAETATTSRKPSSNVDRRKYFNETILSFCGSLPNSIEENSTVL